ncbi:hypothetical protein [Bacillus sp. HMF5848]|uniref:hypothetical protein n=1 Tax=Bacillus sp. HMF5848 TaxID=2495421 RepID=UPI0021ADEE19|nr:hypothetical protein [Bacillus sp. HMF5848]
MKIKEMGLSVVLNAFLGYLWILFVDNIVSVASTIDNAFIVGGIIIVIGTTLFGEIVRRTTRFDEYKFTHPVKLIGFLSFGSVVIINLTIFN